MSARAGDLREEHLARQPASYHADMYRKLYNVLICHEESGNEKSADFVRFQLAALLIFGKLSNAKKWSIETKVLKDRVRADRIIREAEQAHAAVEALTKY